MNDFSGLVVPLPTPFDETGGIDEPALARHLDFLSERGVRRVMVNGTTGEFFSTTPTERIRMLDVVRRRFEGTVVAHVSELTSDGTVEAARRAEDSGADAVVALPPIYPADLPPSALIDWFGRLSEAAQLPLVLYNFPKHAGNAIVPKVLEAVEHVALKDSAKNAELIPFTPRYFVGSSSELLSFAQRGAAGFVSAVANVRPELYSAFETLVLDARSADALVLQEEIRSYAARFSSSGIPGLKRTLSRRLPGGYPDRVRPPLTG